MTPSLDAASAQIIRDGDADLNLSLVEDAPLPSVAQASAPAEQTHVSGVLLRVLANVAAQHGLPRSAVLPGEAENPSTIEPIALRVPLARYRRLIHRAVEHTQQPALGLFCGLYASEASFDVLAPLVGHVPSLRHAISAARRFQALAFEGLHIHLSQAAGVARLECEVPRALDDVSDRFLAEFVVAGFARLLRGFGGTQDDLFSAHFEHDRPAYSTAYATAFDGAERFRQTFAGLQFAADLLDRPHAQANAPLQELVRRHAEARLQSLPHPSRLADSLRQLLSTRLASNVPTMECAARAAGLSVRSLRRRLATEGVSFRDLVRERQCEQACALLRDPEPTLQSVADTMGFANVGSFHRAFKRWTGMTAAEYRARFSVGWSSQWTARDDRRVGGCRQRPFEPPHAHPSDEREHA